MRLRKLLDWRKLLIYKVEGADRANRWSYYGLHGLISPSSIARGRCGMSWRSSCWWASAPRA